MGRSSLAKNTSWAAFCRQRRTAQSFNESRVAPQAQPSTGGVIHILLIAKRSSDWYCGFKASSAAQGGAAESCQHKSLKTHLFPTWLEVFIDRSSWPASILSLTCVSRWVAYIGYTETRIWPSGLKYSWGQKRGDGRRKRDGRQKRGKGRKPVRDVWEKEDKLTQEWILGQPGWLVW